MYELEKPGVPSRWVMQSDWSNRSSMAFPSGWGAESRRKPVLEGIQIDYRGLSCCRTGGRM